MKGCWLALAMALGGALGAASCTDGATVEEACQVVCECQEILPSARAQCEAECVQGAPGNVPQSCLECLVAVEDCSRLQTSCENECGDVGKLP
jgi:hypothetical protein